MLICKMGWHQILGLLCFLFSLHSSLPFASPLCPPDQRDALLRFKNSFVLDAVASDYCHLHYPSYPKTNSWNKGVDCCLWGGVTCDNVTGSIPPTLGNMTNLEMLDVSSNKLCGGIPGALVNLLFLSYLNLSNNRLIGRIPQGMQFDTFSSDSFSGNPGLCGVPLPKECSPGSSLSTFGCKGHENWFKQKTVWIGYSSGIVIGISIAYIAVEIRRPKWLAQGVRMLERRAAEWMEKPKRKVTKFHGK
ncbi:receptor-like protein 9DC3 [Syzygium oleosum]|uniref:receptor-like protein 9DC3 n=1 Tax=Syzygium oleosum TaxID=219896 RepID=UPI0011D1FD40|nr:receptor-like protein 9DC3 [Syzygium oleosum]